MVLYMSRVVYWKRRCDVGGRFYNTTMFVVYLTLALAAAAIADLPGNMQLLEYAQQHPEGSGIMTTSYGYPVPTSEAFGGSRRDSNLLSAYALEQLSSFSLERIPPRINHANGSGAKGYFEVLHDVSNITNAKLFNGIGKKTPIIARIAQGTGEKGSSEILNRNRGFAVKFYTEEGNMDLIGIHTNSFPIKDPVYAASFVHLLRPNPKTGVVNIMEALDFISNIHTGLFTYILVQLSKFGQPKSYRHIPGYALHTFQVENDAGHVSFVKFNWFPDAGFQFMSDEDYKTLGATNPDYFTQDLYNNIANGTYPSWTLCMQVISEHDVKKAKFDIFDITLNWPEKDYPNIPIGKFVLNKNVDNHFAELEQASFNPSNLVWGIRGCDRLFHIRSLIYRDTAIHRLGTGLYRIPVNCPISGAKTFNRDGRPPVGDNGGDSINYYPNSFNGLVPSNKTLRPLVVPNTVPESNNYWQVADYYHGLSEDEQTALINGLARTLASVPPMVREKLYAALVKVDTELADRVQKTLDTMNASTESESNSVDV